MEDFTKKFGFIIGFLVMLLVVQASFGDKFTEKMCILIMMGMCISKADNFIQFLQDKLTIK